MGGKDILGKKDSHLAIGKIGEEAARSFYKKRRFRIVDTNYWKPYGEIDIVAEKGGVLYFIEVKSVSCKTFDDVSLNSYLPAENMHGKKRDRLKRVIQVYLAERRHEGEWQCDLALVFVNMAIRRSRVELLEDVIL